MRHKILTGNDAWNDVKIAPGFDYYGQAGGKFSEKRHSVGALDKAGKMTAEEERRQTSKIGAAR